MSEMLCVFPDFQDNVSQVMRFQKAGGGIFLSPDMETIGKVIIMKSNGDRCCSRIGCGDEIHILFKAQSVRNAVFRDVRLISPGFSKRYIYSEDTHSL